MDVFLKEILEPSEQDVFDDLTRMETLSSDTFSSPCAVFRKLLPSKRHKKVTAFCDVDEKKIRKGFYTYEESEERPKPQIPIRHFRDATPPFIICVKLDLTGGAFEANLNMLNLKEGMDYYHFN